MRDIQQFFKFGLDRDIPPLASPPQDVSLPILNLGPGKRKPFVPGVKLGLPDWNAISQPIPFKDEQVMEIHAYQFLEHFVGDIVIKILRECERVLCPGGVLNIVVPYYNSGHMAQALDHKSSFNEETWHWLFGNEYYDDHEGGGWRLKVHCCFIMGIVERNLDLFTQLTKEG